MARSDQSHTYLTEPVHEGCKILVQQGRNVSKRVMKHVRLLDVIELVRLSDPSGGAKSLGRQQLEKILNRNQAWDHLQRHPVAV